MQAPTDMFTNIVEQQNTSLTSIATALNSNAQYQLLFLEALRYAATFPSVISAFANDKNYITSAEMTSAISNAIGGNPAIVTTVSTLQQQLDNNTSATTSILNQLINKVDKIDGKGLSTNDFTTAEKQKLLSIANEATKNSTDTYLLDRTNHTGIQGISTIANLQTVLDGKVNIINGKGLSTNDFTTTLKTQYDNAYTHSQIATGNPHGTTKSDIGLGNVDNTSDVNKPISIATQTALNLKANSLDVYIKTEIDSKLQVKANSSAVMYPSQNLSGLTDISVARSNLGIYSKAEVDAILRNQNRFIKVTSSTTITSATPKVRCVSTGSITITIVLNFTQQNDDGLEFIILNDASSSGSINVVFNSNLIATVPSNSNKRFLYQDNSFIIFA